MLIQVKRKAECSEGEMDEFERLVIEGDEVSPRGLRRRIEKAEALAFCCDGNNVIGIGALKNPDRSYTDRVFKKAKATLDPSRFTKEIGWVFVDNTYRRQHIGSRLVHDILRFAGEVDMFATTRANNDAMQSILVEYGFCENGAPYQSEDEDRHELKLFIKVQ